MKKLQEGIWMSEDDSEIIALMDKMRTVGVPLPNIETTEKNKVLMTGCVISDGKQVDLAIFQYFSKIGDSDYGMTYVENFLTKNPVNFRAYCKDTGTDPLELLAEITKQTDSVVKRLHYPMYISAIISPDWIGLKATIEHPVEEVTNMNGSKN